MKTKLNLKRPLEHLCQIEFYSYHVHVTADCNCWFRPATEWAEKADDFTQ